MRMTSDAGHSWDVHYIVSPTFPGDRVAVSLEDGRKLSEIAAEFDAAKRLSWSAGQGETRVQAVGGLVSISRTGDRVAVRLLPEVTGDG